MAPWTTDLCRLNLRPPLYEEGGASFWDDDYISERILEAHLDPDIDAASRRPGTIDAEAAWISSRLPAGARVLELGCGPGLYSHRLALKGLMMVGVDISRNSLRHAEARAAEAGLEIDYRRADYREMEFREEFDAALLIYGDLGALTVADRDNVLERVRQALRPGALLIFDVMTLRHQRNHPYGKDWYFSPGGFWRPGPHFVLQQSFEYEGGIFLLRQAVLEPGKDVVVYDMWDHTYGPAELTALLRHAGFDQIEIFSDLAGTPYREDTEWLGVSCRRTTF